MIAELIGAAYMQVVFDVALFAAGFIAGTLLLLGTALLVEASDESLPTPQARTQAIED
jgi:hypothetical protein